VRTRLVRIGSLLGVTLVLAFYAEALAHAPATGQDLRTFYAAAVVLRHGGDPYDPRQLARWEERLYRPTTAAGRTALAENPYVQGPPLAIALLPLVGQPVGLIYRGWAIILALAAAVALALSARLWPMGASGGASGSRSLRYAGLLLVSPITFVGVFLGQPDAILLLAFVGALTLYRRYPLAAGALVALGLVKPQIMAGPLLLVAALAWREGRIFRYMAGLLLGCGVLLGASAAIAGPAIVLEWARGLAGFGATTVYAQVDVSSLSTLYVGWAPHALAVICVVAGLGAWAALSVGLWTTARCAEGRRWWLMTALTLWLLVTPYAHPHDDALLLPAAWYLLGHGPYKGATRLLALLTLLAWWLLPMTSVLGLRPPIVRGLGIVPILLLAALLMTRRPVPRSGYWPLSE